MNKATEAKIFFENFLSKLRVHDRAGGIEITDQVIRISYFDGKYWQFKALKIAPGIIVGGVIKDKEAFHSIILEVKKEFFNGKRSKKGINVVLCVSSANIYSQVFSLPIVQGDTLEKAVGLNIQMISPLDFSKTYADWQMLSHNETTGQSEFLSVFIDKDIIDEYVLELSKVGLTVMAVDSKALILARLMREKKDEIDINKSYTIVDVDNTGIDFIIVKNGQLSFEYMNQWAEIADNKGQISSDAFLNALRRGIIQVINFYSQHWHGQIDGIFIISNVLYEEAKKTLSESASVKVLECPTSFNGQDIATEWFVVFGCGMRSFEFEKTKEEISLLNISAEENFLRTQIVNFVDFWRVVVPIILVFSIAVLVSVDIFISNMSQKEAADLSVSNAGNSKQVQDALALVDNFNKSVSLINNIETNSKQQIPILSDLESVAINNNISITNISFDSSVSSTLSFEGSAISQDNIFSFQKSLQGDSHFSNVNVPLSAIQKQVGGNLYTFTLTLTVN
jgi:hypothetical protein